MSHKIQTRRILDEAFSQGNTDVLDELMTEDFVNHNAPPGMDTSREGVKSVIRVEREGFPTSRSTSSAISRTANTSSSTSG